MELKTTGVAGTMESSDIQIVLEPRTEGGIEVSLTSSVMNQFGRQIVKVIRDQGEHKYLYSHCQYHHHQR